MPPPISSSVSSASVNPEYGLSPPPSGLGTVVATTPASPESQIVRRDVRFTQNEQPSENLTFYSSLNNVSGDFGSLPLPVQSSFESPPALPVPHVTQLVYQRPNQYQHQNQHASQLPLQESKCLISVPHQCIADRIPPAGLPSNLPQSVAQNIEVPPPQWLECSPHYGMSASQSNYPQNLIISSECSDLGK